MTLLGVHGNATMQAFARLAVRVRRRVHESTPGARITPEGFAVRADGVEDALDLVALCREPTAWHGRPTPGNCEPEMT